MFTWYEEEQLIITSSLHCLPPPPSYFSFLKLSRRESLTSSCTKRLKEGARQRLFRPNQLTMSMGIKLGNRSSAHTATHSGAARSHNTSCSGASIKPHWREPCPLLSNCHAEMFTFTYKWPGCHVMSHNVSWTNNVSYFSICLAALKPSCSLCSNTQEPWLQKKEDLVSLQWNATLNESTGI